MVGLSDQFDHSGLGVKTYFQDKDQRGMSVVKKKGVSSFIVSGRLHVTAS